MNEGLTWLEQHEGE